MSPDFTHWKGKGGMGWGGRMEGVGGVPGERVTKTNGSEPKLYNIHVHPCEYESKTEWVQCYQLSQPIRSFYISFLYLFSLLLLFTFLFTFSFRCTHCLTDTPFRITIEKEFSLNYSSLICSHLSGISLNVMESTRCLFAVYTN